MAYQQRENRPPATARQSTAPSVLTVNGHFAGVGEASTKSQYEHGIQVIDENQNFKCVHSRHALFPLESNLLVAVTSCPPIW